MNIGLGGTLPKPLAYRVYGVTQYVYDFLTAGTEGLNLRWQWSAKERTPDRVRSYRLFVFFDKEVKRHD